MFPWNVDPWRPEGSDTNVYQPSMTQFVHTLGSSAAVFISGYFHQRLFSHGTDTPVLWTLTSGHKSHQHYPWRPSLSPCELHLCHQDRDWPEGTEDTCETPQTQQWPLRRPISCILPEHGILQGPHTGTWSPGHL